MNIDNQNAMLERLAMKHGLGYGIPSARTFRIEPLALAFGRELLQAVQERDCDVEFLAKVLWDSEIIEQKRRDERDKKNPCEYASWPEDARKQPYCQSTYRQAEIIAKAIRAQKYEDLF